MKDFFSKLITVIITFAIIVVFVVIGYIVYKEINNIGEEVVIENFKTEVSSKNNTIDENIKTPEVVNADLSGVENPNKKTQTENYNNVQINRYFYSQLDEESKYIYKALESNKEQMKTGTKEIEFGEYFTNILNKENGGDLLGEYYQSAIEAYTYDNPEVFYLSPSKMFLNIETTTTNISKKYNVYISCGKEASYLIDEFQTKDAVDNAIAKVQAVRDEVAGNRTGDTLQDIKMVHNYLIDTIDYDSSISGNNTYNIYGALVNKTCVCEGYARAFKYILDYINIPCVLVVGTGTNSNGETERHAWNYVQYNGSWYAVDVTWDDPIVIGGVANYETKMKYFMKTASEFNTTHSPDGQFTSGGKIFKYPELAQ